MTKIKVETYHIYVGNEMEAKLESLIPVTCKRLFIITDEHVYSLHIKSLREALKSYVCEVVVIKPGEQSKSLGTYQEVIQALLEKQIKKDDCLVAFGGGVVGDLTGFIASTLFRGMKYIQIPTTLLAQVDSSIGGKTGLDLEIAKNIIGSFYNPRLVFIDTKYLETLSQREYRNGLIEMIKTGLIRDQLLYERLKKQKKATIEDIIQTIHIKKDIVLRDPYDQKDRHILNFGHTYGHAIEAQTKYQVYKHGEAVAYGILMAVSLGDEMLGEIKGLYQELKTLFLELGVIKEPLLVRNTYHDYLKYDKKVTREGIRFVVLEKVGKAKVIRMRLEDLV